VRLAGTDSQGASLHRYNASNAVAEPRRRDIRNYLALEERTVTDIGAAMEMQQPSVSKHLKVLKGVGLNSRLSNLCSPGSAESRYVQWVS
jgi:DNA-binding transcriptional ArsR family regulator